VRTFRIGSFVPKRDIRAFRICAGCDTFHYLRAEVPKPGHYNGQADAIGVAKLRPARSQ
jgi:hypothetical protein